MKNSVSLFSLRSLLLSLSLFVLAFVNTHGQGSPGCGTLSTPLTSYTASINPVCPGENTVLTLSGGIDGTGAVIRWYTGPNGTGFNFYNGPGPITITSSNPVTNYYVRREGACNTTADLIVSIYGDTELPVITCQNLQTYLGPGGNITISPWDVIASATDNCRVDSFSVNVFPNNFSAAGMFNVVASISDISSNINSCNATVTVSKRPTTLVYNGVFEGEIGENVTASATLTDDIAGGTPLGSRTINFNLGTFNGSAITNASGVATLVIPLNQAAGDYALSASYGGNGTFQAASDSGPFTILNLDMDDDGVVDSLDNCIMTPNADQLDADCDNIGDVCDICPDGDDRVDYNEDGIPDCSQLLNYKDYSPEWRKGKKKKKKIQVCHNGNTIKVNKNALPAHFNHGDVIGPCISCSSGSTARVGEIAAPTMTIFPNPASKNFTLRLENHNGPATILVFDQLGRKVVTRNLEAGKSTLKFNASRLNLQSGVYFVTVQTQQGQITRQLLVLE